MRFRDRVEAGRQLGARIRDERLADPVVLGLPRGGVIVAAEVADALGAPLDIVVARKLGVPWQPELAFGAVAPGTVVLRDDVIAAAGIRRADIAVAAARESARLDELARLYRGNARPVPLRGRTVVIVDDGLATGATATAALRSVRREDPRRVTVAVPVCAAQIAAELRREVDDVICLNEYDDFHSVGMYYEDFAPVPDAGVRERIAWSRGTPIRSARVDLVSLWPELLDAFIAGDRGVAQRLADFAIPEEFPGQALGLMRFRRDQIAEQPDWLPWSLRAIVLREPARVMVGYANFHGPPGVNDLGTADAAETGYTVFAEYRGRGFATEVAQAMMEWAAREHGVRHFISGVAPDNAPSLRVNEKLGFARTGDVVDGEIIFELRRS